MTFLIVTHDQEEAMTVADRITVADHDKADQVAGPSRSTSSPIRATSPTSSATSASSGRVTAIDGSLIRMEAAAPASRSSWRTTRRPRSGRRRVDMRPERCGSRTTRRSDRHQRRSMARSGTSGYIGDTSVYHVKTRRWRHLPRRRRRRQPHGAERPIGWDDRGVAHLVRRRVWF